GKPRLDEPSLVTFKPRHARFAGLRFVDPRSRPEHHLIHGDPAMAFHTGKRVRHEMPLFARAVVCLIAVRAAELNGIDGKFKLTRRERSAALRTCPRLEI